MTETTTPAATRTRAVGYLHPGPIDALDALIDIEIEVPPPGPRDLLVEVKAVSVNPHDTKVRSGVDPGGQPKILGSDAAGVVRAAGGEVSFFKPGDEVYYAGSSDRPGSNAGLQLVDERITGHKPASLTFEQAAALPLTSITAWELLFDRLRLTGDSGGTLLVLAAAGGVGSMVVQLARNLTGVTIIGTASRPESAKWAVQMGAHHVISHSNLVEEVTAVAPGGVDYIVSPYSAGRAKAFARLLKPRGAVVAIDNPAGLDIRPLMFKSASWHFEMMFTRPLLEPESTYQHDLLEQVAQLVDAGTLATTASSVIDGIRAATLTEAHRRSESGLTVGKIVLRTTHS